MARGPDSDAYQQATALAREIREIVAGQLRELVVEGDQMGSRGELATRVQHVVTIEQQRAQAVGRQQQAREMGLPLAPSVEAEREALELLRDAVMGVAVAAGGWVAAMDFEQRRAHDRLSVATGADL